VLRVDNDGVNPPSFKAVFAFEGKSVNAPGSFESNAPQIKGCMEDITKHGTRGMLLGFLSTRLLAMKSQPRSFCFMTMVKINTDRTSNQGMDSVSSQLAQRMPFCSMMGR
jgi:hypothetical protein